MKDLIEQNNEAQVKAEADVARVSDELNKVLKEKREVDRNVVRLNSQVGLDATGLLFKPFISLSRSLVTRNASMILNTVYDPVP